MKNNFHFKKGMKKKFQDHKLVLVDEVLELDKKNREAKLNGDNLRSERKKLSEQVGSLMKAGQKDEANKVKEEVQKFFGDKVYETIIPRNVRLAEAPSHGLPIIDYDPRSKGSLVYVELAKEVVAAHGK